MNSPTVSGIVSSSIVVTTSTNGTRATTARNSSGRWLTTAPISRPPALPPSIASSAGVVRPAAIRLLGAGDEVVEGGLLLAILAGLVPAAAEVAAAADVGDREDDAAVEQRDARLRERRVDRDAVAAVAVERAAAVRRAGVLAVDERDRHLGAVGGASERRSLAYSDGS
jgi:hypothetical protein